MLGRTTTGEVTTGRLGAVTDGRVDSVTGTETLADAVAEPLTGPALTDALPVIVTLGSDAAVDVGAETSDVVALEGSVTSVDAGGNRVAMDEDAVGSVASLAGAVVVVEPAVGSDVVELEAGSLVDGAALFVDVGEDEVDTALPVEGSRIVVIDVLGMAVLESPALLAGNVDVESAVGSELVVEVVASLEGDVGAVAVLVVEPAVGTSVVVVAGLVGAAVLACEVVDAGADGVAVEDAGAEDVAALVLVTGSFTLEVGATDVLVDSETVDVEDVGATLDVNDVGAALDVDDVDVALEDAAVDEALVVDVALEDDDVTLDVDDGGTGSELVELDVEGELTGEDTAGAELVAGDEFVELDVTTPRDDDGGNKLATDELVAGEDTLGTFGAVVCAASPWPGNTGRLCAGAWPAAAPFSLTVFAGAAGALTPLEVTSELCVEFMAAGAEFGPCGALTPPATPAAA